jgi:hypothetical protein
MDIMNKELPKALRNWFLVQVIIDIIFAIPLMFIPVLFLGSLGWQVVYPIAARLVHDGVMSCKITFS